MIFKKIFFLTIMIAICPVTMADKIYDAKHKQYMVAGDSYNGQIYHQDHLNRSNANWILEPTGD